MRTALAFCRFSTNARRGRPITGGARERFPVPGKGYAISFTGVCRLADHDICGFLSPTSCGSDHFTISSRFDQYPDRKTHSISTAGSTTRDKANQDRIVTGTFVYLNGSVFLDSTHIEASIGSQQIQLPCSASECILSLRSTLLHFTEVGGRPAVGCHANPSCASCRGAERPGAWLQ